jgi:membrane protein YdbS with pleckstrin-like domain
MTDPVARPRPDRLGLAAMTSADNAPVLRYLVAREDLVLAARQHPAVLIGPVTAMLGGLLATFVLAQMVPRSDQDIIVALFVAWMVLLARAGLKILAWTSNFFVLTSDRILCVTGLLTRTVSTIPFLLVDDVDIRRSPVGRRLGYGGLTVGYGGQNQVRQRIQYLAYPEELAQKIREACFLTGEIPAPGAAREAPSR